MQKTFRWPIIAVAALLASCEREIDLAPVRAEPKLVVEATIENDQAPVVRLTNSLNFFSTISLAELAGSFVHDAVVTMSNGERVHVLKEYEQPLGAGASLYYYSTDSASLATAFDGELGKAYTLTIAAGGQAYTATTTIPKMAKTIESLYYEEDTHDKDSLKVILYGSFNDPPGLGNYTRYFTSVNDSQFLPGLTSIYDDQVIDGKNYDMQIEKGVDRNSDIDFENYSFFHKGDKVVVKFCNVDKAVYDFWRTMEYSYNSIGNPFSSPTRVAGNISNGALGYFGGYAAQYTSIQIPK